MFLSVVSCKIRTLDKVTVQVVYLRSDPGNYERGSKERKSQNEVLCKGGCCVQWRLDPPGPWGIVENISPKLSSELEHPLSSFSPSNEDLPLGLIWKKVLEQTVLQMRYMMRLNPHAPVHPSPGLSQQWAKGR